MSSERITAMVFVLCATVWIAAIACGVRAHSKHQRHHEKEIDWEPVYGAVFFGCLVGYPLFVGFCRGAVFAVTGL